MAPKPPAFVAPGGAVALLWIARAAPGAPTWPPSPPPSSRPGGAVASC